jgi:hypothetical protein
LWTTARVVDDGRLRVGATRQDRRRGQLAAALAVPLDEELDEEVFAGEDDDELEDDASDDEPEEVEDDEGVEDDDSEPFFAARLSVR